ncbi:MAG: TetR/AcrR family transcriptional regulator [Pseudomonadota bacterium]|nr:TetR/AcrR family transcriptional regulator [Pseudomonadota bacterium]
MTEAATKRAARNQSAAASGDEMLDGRKTRTLRTRTAVIAAVISLQQSGVLRPTAKQIAETARVSVRSLFQHFATHESLTAAVMEELWRDLANNFYEATPPGPLGERIRLFATKRADLLEKLAPHRRAAAVLAPMMTPRITRRRMQIRKRFRDEVAMVFATEMSMLAPKASRQLFESLVCIYESEVWEALRHGQKLSFRRAREVLEQLTWGQLLLYLDGRVERR